jgi:eukaryotic-like serine/threonine-protein kinase
MKVCPNCQTKYPDDANFCPQETCASPEGPRRLEVVDVVQEAQPPRYELEGQLGGSRSGAVFRARDTQTGDAVAYKRVARAAVSTPAVLERSLRELKQLQRAQSPRLARVVDYGKEPEGGLFVVTELVEGQPLDQVVASSGAFPLDRAKKIAAQIGEALLEGQKVGVVHHDLASKNVLLAAGDEVKLINFIAPCPVTDTIFGVPEYLSPEQAEGKLVDQRSNTYSLGALLMFMLTGKSPVEGADAAAILEQILKGTPVPPSLRAPGLNAEIDRVILKAMDRSPNRRPLTMRQFLTDVSGLVAAGAPVAADPNRGVGFAKTMMFTGGSPEVQKLVNQALAARAEANGAAAGAPHEGTPPPAGAPPTGVADSQATPPPMLRPGDATLGPRRTHGAAIAATMVSLPAVGSSIPGASPQAGAGSPPGGATPASMAATPPPTTGVGPSKPAGAAGAFRETLWFKQGDVDQMVADARAKIEASRGKAGPAPEPEPEQPVADAKPLEDRYVDDGSVTVDDRKAYSLRSGATSTALPTVGGVVPGERMSESEMMGEIGSGKRIGIIVFAVVVVLALVGVLVVGFRHKKVAESAAALTPVAVPTQPAAPPAPIAPPAPPPSPPTPVAAESAGDDEAAAKPRPAHKHAAAKVAAKKPKGKKHR